MSADELHEEQFQPAPNYYDVMLQDYRNTIKEFVDWFLISKRNLLIKRCRLAASRSGLGREAWEDLLSECCLEAYRIGERYDSTRGDLQKFLLTSLWRFPFRNNNLRRYRNYGKQLLVDTYAPGHGQLYHGNNSPDNSDGEGIDWGAIDGNTIASSTLGEVDLAERRYIEITEPLTLDERSLLQLHFGLGLSRVTIAAFLGRGESTIRSRLNVILGKIKVSGTRFDE